MRSHILLVEDDPIVREAASLVLEGAGFSVSAVSDGVEALHAIATDSPPDLIVLDIVLPGIDGFEVCRRVRATSGIPIVMLTARAATDDLVHGLSLGADDYVTKPFEPAELAARIHAVLRRTRDTAATSPSHHAFTIRDLTIDEDAYQARRGGTDLGLTAMEFRLLAELARNAGTVLTREILLERVWGYDYLGDSRLVDMAILRVRDKLGHAATPPDYIATVRGVGYRFESFPADRAVTRRETA